MDLLFIVWVWFDILMYFKVVSGFLLAEDDLETLIFRSSCLHPRVLGLQAGVAGV